MSRIAFLQFLSLFPMSVDHVSFPNEDCIELLYDCIYLPDDEFYSLYCKACNKGLSHVRWSHFTDELNEKYDAILDKAHGYISTEKLNINRRLLLRFCSVWDDLYQVSCSGSYSDSFVAISSNLF